MRIWLLGICLATSLLAAPLWANDGGATYRRNRHPGGGGFHGGGFRHPGWGWGGFYNPPIVVGSWYQRPYPYHFDYYRWRYSTPPVQQAVCPGCGVQYSAGTNP